MIGRKAQEPGQESILDWFNVYNLDHLKAYVHAENTGIWPEGFLPKGIYLPELYLSHLKTRIADAYIEDKLRRTPEVKWAEGDKAIIKRGWGNVEKILTVLGPPIFLEQWWVPVKDKDEEDPDFYKEAALKKV